ncbi:PadR family transcriptional regulator [Streptomyces sp. G45]|uniref:PadR family transcriptional regulator n=1 Tax=Streptomyces sp. G45 TaxID=3406627 RepID=UPI003C1CFDFA
MDQERRKVGNPLALAVLAFLAQRPMHPYEIGRLLKERNLQQSIKYRSSSLYMVVEQLHRDGYVTQLDTTREGRRPERTPYALTDEGRAELAARIRDLLATPVKEYPRFQAALSLVVVVPPDEVPDLLTRRGAALTERSREIRARLDEAPAKGVDRVFVIEHEYELALIEAESRFIQQLADLIREDTANLGAFWREFHAQGHPGGPTAGSATA